jgi:AGZA family xanthine/uracil permease-like MFS transporter
MHGERIGLAQTPIVALSYFIMAAIFFGCAKFVVVAPKPAEEPPEPHGASVPA